MASVLVVAPHPDDETLGCGGTLLRHIDRGDQVHWLIVTSIPKGEGYPDQKINDREEEISAVQGKYPFTEVHFLDFPTTRLDEVPLHHFVEKISSVMRKIRPEIMYLPYRGDIHSDHAATFDACMACTKWFRYPHISSVFIYETLSETEFGINPDNNGFRPNYYVNIEGELLEKKLEIMRIYSSEMGEYPFPRSEHAIRSLASYRGVASGFHSAEAFMLIKGVWS